MSKDMLGPVTRALVGVPQDRLTIVTDIANRLAAQNGADFHGSLADFLRNGNSAKPPPPAIPTLTVWKEITVYPADSEQSVTIAWLTEADFYVSDWAKDIMSKPGYKTLAEPKNLKLVRMKVSDLCLKRLPTTNQIWERIQEIGGELCPPELGPTLRKEFCDQPVGDLFWLAMKQITDSNGRPDVFYVKRNDDGKRWLKADYSNPDYQWCLDFEVVFVLRE